MSNTEIVLVLETLSRGRNNSFNKWVIFSHENEFQGPAQYKCWETIEMQTYFQVPQKISARQEQRQILYKLNFPSNPSLQNDHTEINTWQQST